MRIVSLASMIPLFDYWQKLCSKCNVCKDCVWMVDDNCGGLTSEIPSASGQFRALNKPIAGYAGSFQLPYTAFPADMP
jgi:hypothetical protein